MQMAPIAPPFTSWMNPNPNTGQIPGIHIPGATNPATQTYLGTTYGELSRPGFPRTGSNLTDTYTASSLLGPEHFNSYHKYAVLWEPGEYVRWYLDDVFMFEVNKEALQAQKSADGQSVGDRLIPKEAMYLIINVAMANQSWSKVSETLQFPAVMSVDYVRIWQRSNAVDVGCNPTGYPTEQILACHKEEYLSPDEIDKWSLGSCNSITSQDNLFLVTFGGTVTAVALGAFGMMWLMQKHLTAAQAAAGKWSLEEQQAARATGDRKQAGCYINSNSAKTIQQIMHARPDLIDVATDCLNKARR
eukprot:GHRR01020007.1.p1 GENE.GHRR01020007.1~~GHRR01020007.1.p1  ORF type:complete len:303 (+),score=84.17 GHRR01020007.1:142-1050(+)